MAAKIGIPRGMYYYKHFPFTKTFLTEIGAEIVPSPETTKEILDKGVQYCIDDACLPVKVYHGHAHYLRDKADFLLIPRLTSISKGEYICPKFGGLPEMVKYSVPQLPRILDVEVNMLRSRWGLDKALYRLAYGLGIKNPFRIRQAAGKALSAHRSFKGRVLEGHSPNDVIDGKPPKYINGRDTVGLVAHPYLLYDSYINMNLLNKLTERGIRYVTTEMVDPHIIEQRCMELPKRMFWSSGKELIGSALYLMDNSRIDGVLFLTAFSCGIDSLVGEFIEKYARRDYRKPFMVLNIDEHTGDAGFNTRIEAFKDLLNGRCKDATDLSSHG